MKKYISPEMTVVKLQMKSVILQCSMGLNDTYEIENPDEILSREQIFNNNNSWGENW